MLRGSNRSSEAATAGSPSASRGQPPPGFDITARVRDICGIVADQVAELRHVEIDRIGFSVSQTRRATPYGIFASLTPLRFAGGAQTQIRRGREVTVQRVVDQTGQELLYILTLYLPRFMDLDFEEKLTTLFHELWHISPQFNGDLRRHKGRCYAHTSSQAAFDAQMRNHSQRWLACGQDESQIGFLRLNFSQLSAEYGRVFGSKYARPRLVPLPSTRLPTRDENATRST